MTEYGEHPTIRTRLESLLERLAVVPTGKLLHITHIAEMMGERAMCPRLETDPVILRHSVNSVS